jgi:hypothetical protein
MACVLACGCRGGAASDSGTASDSSATASPPGAYQTAEGFCAGNPKLSGGNLVGTWTIVGVCGISTSAEGNCAGTTVKLSLDAHGTVTFNADMTGSMDITLDMKKTSTVPMTCMSAQDCASLQTSLTFDGGAGSAVSATCEPWGADPTSCACEEDYSPHRFQGSGTYRFELPSYLRTSGSWDLQGGFLVQGNTLRLDGMSFFATEFDVIGQR